MIYLDYLRFIAIFAVVGFHAYQNITFATPLFSGGYLGVDVFLFISGFLIAKSLRQLDQSGIVAGGWSFLDRRVQRVAVPAIAISILVAAFAVATGIGTWIPALWSVLFMYNFYMVLHQVSYFQSDRMPDLFLGMWYLGLLVQLYFLHFVLRAVFRKDRGYYIVVGVIIALMLVAAAWLSYDGQPNAAYVLPSHGFPYLFGVLYQGFDQRRAGRKPAWCGGLVAASGAIVCALVLLLIMVFGDYSDFLVYSLTATLTTALLILAIQCSGRLSNCPPSLLSGIGEMSFSLYLWNVPVISAVHHFFYDAPPADQLGLAIALIFALSFLSYRLIEVPLKGAAGGQPRSPLGLATALIAALVFGFGGYGWYRAACGYQASVRLAGEIDNLDATTAYLTGKLNGSEAQVALLSAKPKGADARPGNHRAAAAASQEKIDTAQQSEQMLLGWTPKPQPDYAYGYNQGVVQNPLVADKKVLFITDSILLGWSGYVLHEMPDAYLDGLVGRSFVQCVDLIGTINKQPHFKDVQYVVVELGSNGPVARADLQQFIMLAGPRQIVLIVPAVPRWWEAEVVSQYMWAQTQYPNVHLVQWNAISSGKDNYFIEDGVHLTWFGAQPMVLAILKQLYALGYQSPVPPAPPAGTAAALAQATP
jgi:peptidoglycan/LPS O-acetylase OafA/YrhL